MELLGIKISTSGIGTVLKKNIYISELNVQSFAENHNNTFPYFSVQSSEDINILCIILDSVRSESYWF